MSRITKSPDERRNELIDAAEMLFIENGYDQTSVSDIVKKVNVAQGTFYYYFNSKEDILHALIERHILFLEQTTRAKLNQTPQDSWLQLQNAMNMLLGLMDFETRFYQYLHQEKSALLHEKFTEQLIRAFIPLLTPILAAGGASGLFRIGRPEETAEILLVIIEHLNDKAHLRSTPEEHDRRKASAEYFLNKLLGIQAGKMTLNF